MIYITHTLSFITKIVILSDHNFNYKRHYIHTLCATEFFPLKPALMRTWSIRVVGLSRCQDSWSLRITGCVQ